MRLAGGGQIANRRNSPRDLSGDERELIAAHFSHPKVRLSAPASRLYSVVKQNHDFCFCRVQNSAVAID